jgi:hypothetical protein
MLWHQILGYIGEKGLLLLHGKGMVEGMSNCFQRISISVKIVYMGSKIG